MSQEPRTFEQLCLAAPKQPGLLAHSHWVHRSARAYLRLAVWWTRKLSSMPKQTNHLMLLLRTYNRDFQHKYYNDDDLAELLRDVLLPRWGKLHHHHSIWVQMVKVWRESSLGTPGLTNFIDVRTCWFDDVVKQALADNFDQVVVIAAGFDTRAFRLAAGGVRFFELDRPAASQMKQKLAAELLCQYPQPEFVGADLAETTLEAALATTTFDPSHKTLFIAEGLTWYLPPAAVRALLSSVSACAAPGSRLCFDFMHLSAVNGTRYYPGFETAAIQLQQSHEPIVSALDEDPKALQELLMPYGMQVQQLMSARQAAERYMPGKPWKARKPRVSPFWSFLAAERLDDRDERVTVATHVQGAAAK